MSSKSKLYIAYGSNLNLEQMAKRCPAAKVVGTAVLQDWRLWFRGGSHAVATIEREKGFSVPVLVWKITPKDELSLDRYEAWPHLYRKEVLSVTIDGCKTRAMVYIMNGAGRPYGIPSATYLDTIKEGYKSANFDLSTLVNAVLSSKEVRHD